MHFCDQQMKELTHENLNPFLGVCFNGSKIYILSAYCQRGSLQDILNQDEVKLDWMFKGSLIQDLVHVCMFIIIIVILSLKLFASSELMIQHYTSVPPKRR